MTLNLVRRLIKGTPLSAEDHDGNLDILEAALAPAVRGQVSRMATATVTIETQGVYVPASVTGTLDSAVANGMTLGATNLFTLKNTSGATRLMRVYGSIDAHGGNNLTLGIKLALDGTPIDATECRAFTGSGAAEAKLVTSWIISMPATSELSLLLANHTSTANVEFRRGRIVASEIR